MQPETTSQSSLLEWAVASRSMPGQVVSGDMHLVKPFRNGVLVAVVDGIGHGDEATAAAKTAVATLAESPNEPVIWLVKKCHEALAKTRGAVMTLASFQAGEGTMTWVGIGNVDGVLQRADQNANPPMERVLLRGGTVGFQLPPLNASVIPVSRGDTLILVSDGIKNTSLDRPSIAGEPVQKLADRILVNNFRGMDDAMVLVARYNGIHHE